MDQLSAGECLARVPGPRTVWGGPIQINVAAAGLSVELTRGPIDIGSTHPPLYLFCNLPHPCVSHAYMRACVLSIHPLI